MSPENEIRIIAVLVAVSCSAAGTFLVLRGKAMITDSVTHSILPGIAAGFLVSGNVSSPLLVAGAFAAAFISVVSSEALSRARLMSEDSAIAFVYPFLFSAGVIMVSGYAGNAHLDVDSVLLGEIALAPLDRVALMGIDVPVSMLSALSVALVCGVFIAVFYKELKLSTFDPSGAKASGFSGAVFSGSFAALVCLMCIVSFSATGSVMLIALIAAPPCCALLLTDRLGLAIALGVVFAAGAALAGFEAAVAFNTNVAGAVVTILGAVFFVILIFAPRKGILSRLMRSRRMRDGIQTALLLECVSDGEGGKDIRALCRALMWSPERTLSAARRAEKNGYAETDGQTVRVTPEGRAAVRALAPRLHG